MAVSVASQLMLELERDLAELRKEYNMFFSGVNPIEPFEVRQSVEQKLKRLRNLNIHRTEEQFRANNLISKVQTHLQLWTRQVEQKNTGELFGVRRRKSTPPPQEAPRQKGVVIRDPGNQTKEVAALYEEYKRLNLSLGAGKIINYEKFEHFIANQTKKVQSSKGVADVRYEVSVQDDKVVIKTRSVKK